MSYTPKTNPIPIGTAKRPTLGAGDAGFSMFDADLGKRIWWDGAAWITSSGGPADVQVATIQFSAVSANVNHEAASPAAVTGVEVVTNDLGDTLEDITVDITDEGTGSAVAPGQYAAGPWQLVIPAGTPSGTIVPFDFPHVQDPAEAPAIPPFVDVDVALDVPVSADPLVMSVQLGAQDTMVVNLVGGGGA